MADNRVGVDLAPDVLVLQKGRDFEWAFQSFDELGDPTPMQPGRLYFELDTGGSHNAIQRVRVSGTDGGTYRLGLYGIWSGPINYYDSIQNPVSMSIGITHAIEQMSSVGMGNVIVHPAKLFPSWRIDLTLDEEQVLDEAAVDYLRSGIYSYFDQFTQLLGVDVDFYVVDDTHARISVIARKAYDEAGLITFKLTIVGSVLKNFLNDILDIYGILDSATVIFHWVHEYEVEFTGKMGNQLIPLMVTDAANLTGGAARVDTEVVEIGQGTKTIWQFEVDPQENSIAALKVESEKADLIRPRTKWYLVFLPAGEEAGGEPLARGTVAVQK